MTELEQIENNLGKIIQLSNIYKDLINSDISSKEELEITKAKAKCAKEERLKLLVENHKLLKKIAGLLAEEYAENQINYEIYTYWDTLTVGEKLAASDEYLHKYGHLLPQEMTERNAPRIKSFFTKVLQEHPRIIIRLRRIGR